MQRITPLVFLMILVAAAGLGVVFAFLQRPASTTQRTEGTTHIEPPAVARNPENMVGDRVNREDLSQAFVSYLWKKTGSSPVLMTDGRYRLTVDGTEYIVSIENVLKEAIRDGDQQAIIRFADEVLARTEPLPPWPAASVGLRLSIQPADTDFGSIIHSQLTPDTVQVLSFSDAEEKRIRFLLPHHLEAWGIGRDEALQIARNNLGRLLLETPVEISDLTPKRCYKRNLAGLFLPSFRRETSFSSLTRNHLWSVSVRS